MSKAEVLSQVCEAGAAAPAYSVKSVIELVRRREELPLGAIAMHVSEEERNSWPREGRGVSMERGQHAEWKESGW